MDTNRSTASRRGDQRIIDLAKEVSESRDRKVTDVLLRLRSILDETPVGTEEGRLVRQEIWKYNLLKVLVLILRQDYSIIAGEWATAAEMANILSSATCGLSLSGKDLQQLEEEHLPRSVENLLLLARHIHTVLSAMPEPKNSDKEQTVLLAAFKKVLDALVYLCAGYFQMCPKVLSSQWVLQLLVSDIAKVVTITMATMEKMLSIDPHVLSKITEESLLTVMDELIYKLTVNTDVSIAAGACRCLVKFCDHHRTLVEIMCTRYKGLRPLLCRWEGHGFGRDLRHLGLLLESGSALKAKSQRNNECAQHIQAVWRGYSTRKKLKKADNAFAKFQKSYRLKKAEQEQVKLQTQYQTELHHKMKMRRQQLMRQFNEKRLQALEILPASRIEEYLRKEKSIAALRIQALWRGRRERNRLTERQEVARQVHAAIIIQRAVRKWRERIEQSQQVFPTHLKPDGLTDQRRVELNKIISQWREQNPVTESTLENLESLHKNTQELLGRHYYSIRGYRKLQYQCENMQARIDTDSELIALAPPLKDVTQADVDMYSSRSLPVATAAKERHNELLRRLRLPWWKTLGWEDDEEVDEDERERVTAEVMLETMGV